MSVQNNRGLLDVSWSVSTHDGAEEIGVVIRTERGYEAYHHVLGFLATYLEQREAQMAVCFHNFREEAA
jgi:hypothetical protein